MGVALPAHGLQRLGVFPQRCQHRHECVLLRKQLVKTGEGGNLALLVRLAALVPRAAHGGVQHVDEL
jgi:hypothetical protein